MIRSALHTRSWPIWLLASLAVHLSPAAWEKLTLHHPLAPPPRSGPARAAHAGLIDVSLSSPEPESKENEPPARAPQTPAATEDYAAPSTPTPHPTPARPRRERRARRAASTAAAAPVAGMSGSSAVGSPKGSARSNAPLLAAQALTQVGSLALLLDIPRVARHPAAARVAQCLSAWLQVFEWSGLAPLEVLDRLLIVGPELRASGRGLALALHHVPAPRLQRALNMLRERSPRSVWLDAPQPTLAVERAELRSFYIQVSANAFVFTPERETLRAHIDANLPAVADDEIAELYVAEPARALAELPFAIPPSFHWLRAGVSLDTENRVVLNMEAGDESAELAQKSADELMLALREWKLSGASAAENRVVDAVSLQSAGSVVSGSVTFANATLAPFFDYLMGQVREAAPLPLATRTIHEEAPPQVPDAGTPSNLPDAGSTDDRVR